MQLSNIAQFLEIYRKKLSLEDDKRGVIIKIISEVAGITITEDQLVIQKGIVTLKTNPVIKNEIYLYKQKILEKIKEEGSNTIHDIK